MTRTFLVTADLSPADDPIVVAQDLLDDLLDSGYSISAVRPWASPESVSGVYPPAMQETPSPMMQL